MLMVKSLAPISIASCCEELNVMISDGTIIRCNREVENQLFWATIGGLGLTGLITSATLRLQRILAPLSKFKQGVTRTSHHS
ncbi:MAG: hypothetical protein CM15mP49_11330 [Actinomycetota bacterium]|nr:MAG: hypothetical protein CM15mP49_11330 [Actinomycetota bacterium]